MEVGPEGLVSISIECREVKYEGRSVPSILDFMK
jgi:hypothetical protein